MMISPHAPPECARPRAQQPGWHTKALLRTRLSALRLRGTMRDFIRAISMTPLCLCLRFAVSGLSHSDLSRLCAAVGSVSRGFALFAGFHSPWPPSRPPRETKSLQPAQVLARLAFGTSGFEFVSDFGFRGSDLAAAPAALCPSGFSVLRAFTLFAGFPLSSSLPPHSRTAPGAHPIYRSQSAKNGQTWPEAARPISIPPLS